MLGLLDLEVVGHELDRRAAPARPSWRGGRGRCGSCAAGRAGTDRRTRSACCRACARGRSPCARSGAGRSGPWSAGGTGRAGRSHRSARMPRGVSCSPVSVCSISPASVSRRVSSARRCSERMASSPSRSPTRSVSASASAVGDVTPRSSDSSWSRSPSSAIACHRLAHAERVVAVEVVGRRPTHPRHERPQVLAELVHLLAQVRVVEQLLGELLQLRRAARASSS